MSAKNPGILVNFDENRRNSLLKERVEGGYESFTDALSIYDWQIGKLSIALLSFSESTIDYICLAKRGKQIVTSKNRIEFYGTISLSEISIKKIETKLSDKLQKYFIKASQGVGAAIPPATWHALIKILKEERPSVAKEIDRLLSLVQYSGFRLTGESTEVLVQEREALGISLDIFSGGSQLREKVLSQWAPLPDELTNVSEQNLTAVLTPKASGKSSFLKGIPQQFLQEESAIQHDLYNWPGMSPQHEAGISVFEQGDRRLEVHYANRNRLELTLGVDLIYYNEIFELFVLIQYKIMKLDGESFLYRPNPYLKKELNRMDRIYSSLNRPDKISSHQEYRLNDDGFLFKFVPNTGLKAASGELIKGMYITREYLHFLLGPNGPKGPNGGAQITFEGAPRYITNSQFAANVHGGWLGTKGTQSKRIWQIIRRFYEGQNAVMLAYESGPAA